jgi:hypothetical protein
MNAKSRKCDKKGCGKWPTSGQKFCKHHADELKRERKASLQIAIQIEKEAQANNNTPPAQEKIKDTSPALKEGKMHSKSPSWTTASWLMSLELMDILANELTKDIRLDEEEATFVKSLSEEQLKKAISNALPALQTKLAKDHQKLKNQEHVDATALNDKFSAAEGSFTFTYGGMDMYHAGLYHTRYSTPFNAHLLYHS